MKKVIAILTGIAVIVGGLWAAYQFVLVPLLDPPPEIVMESAIDSAKSWVGNSSNTGARQSFVEHFSEMSQTRLERAWNAVDEDDPGARGNWFDLAQALLNVDGTRPEVVGLVDDPNGEATEEEEGSEEELEAWVRIRRDISPNRSVQQFVDYDIPLIRDVTGWRIDLPDHPSPMGGS